MSASSGSRTASAVGARRGSRRPGPGRTASTASRPRCSPRSRARRCGQYWKWTCEMRNLPESRHAPVNSVISQFDRLNAVSHGKGEYAPHGALLCRRRAMGSNDLLPYAPPPLRANRVPSVAGHTPSRRPATADRGLDRHPGLGRRAPASRIRGCGLLRRAPRTTAPRSSATGEAGGGVGDSGGGSGSGSADVVGVGCGFVGVGAPGLGRARPAAGRLRGRRRGRAPPGGRGGARARRAPRWPPSRLPCPSRARTCRRPRDPPAHPEPPPPVTPDPPSGASRALLTRGVGGLDLACRHRRPRSYSRRQRPTATTVAARRTGTCKGRTGSHLRWRSRGVNLPNSRRPQEDTRPSTPSGAPGPWP